MRIKVLSRNGSATGRAMRSALGDRRIRECEGAVNFGLQGDNLRTYEQRFPAITRIPIMNHRQISDKFVHIIRAGEAGVSVPSSKPARDLTRRDNGWIAKPYFSQGGRGIYRINTRARRRQAEGANRTHYVQQEITNRRYEMRVHAWSWVDPSEWIFQKRLHERGDEILTWNHSTGGNFVTVNEPTDPLHDRIRQDVITMMDVFGYRFGAVDFIIQTPGESGAAIPHYFIEWNLCPGWTLDHINDAYVRHFTTLTELTPARFNAIINDPVAGRTPVRGRVQSTTPNAQNVPRQERPLSTPAPERQTPPEREERARQIDNPALRGAGVEPARRPVFSDMEEVVRPADEDELARYRDALAETIDVNFCPQCGRGVNTDVFGALPRFCPGCGQRVRQ